MHPPKDELPGLIIKYFDNDSKGKQSTRAYQTDAELDLYYVENQPLVLATGKVTLVDTNIAFEILPETYA